MHLSRYFLSTLSTGGGPRIQEKPPFGSLPGPAPKRFYSLSVGLISDDFLAVEKVKLCDTFVFEPSSLFCD